MNPLPDIDTSLNIEHLRVIIPVIMGLVGFMIFWFTQGSEKIKSLFQRRYGDEQGQVKLVLFTKYLGAVTIGLLPLVIYLVAFPGTKLIEMGFGFNRETILATFFWIILLGAAMIGIILLKSKSPTMLAKQPEIRVAEWDRRLIIKTLAAWAVYLLGYEFFFRGILLFPIVESIGLWPAIAINVVMYSGFHIPKGADEAIGAIPFSVVLCLLGVATGTIWISYFVHVAMAWTATLVAIKRQPDMKIIRRVS